MSGPSATAATAGAATGSNTGTDPTPKIPTVTVDECFKNFQKYIEHEKRGADESKIALKVFYKDDKSLQDLAPTAKTMIESLFALGCGKEIALQLSVLILYDLVMLIDDSSSMETEQGGERIKTFKRTMAEITSVYDLANPRGIRSVKFINSKKGFMNIRRGHLKKNFGSLKYDGMTRIGSALKERILTPHVWANPMTKPLLVMIITDGEPEGEPRGTLEMVIRDCVAAIEADPTRGNAAVSFHFSRVGDDPAAIALLQNLDDSATVGDNVDCLTVKDSLENLVDPGNRWTVLPKLLLGAIMSQWDELAGGIDKPEQAGEDTQRVPEEDTEVDGGEEEAYEDDDW
ncbi:hypothetical protein Q9L58_010425 [Maublancomyces gigas]|uniref:VWFA domain-containing protein n=1 Tax=Discina gigas TaxID=1032678 RepID=A0ABR3G447_9PEZI